MKPIHEQLVSGVGAAGAVHCGRQKPVGSPPSSPGRVELVRAESAQERSTRHLLGLPDLQELTRQTTGRLGHQPNLQLIGQVKLADSPKE